MSGHDLAVALQGAFKSQIFGGGLALGIVGTVVAVARNVPRRIAGFLKRRLTVTVDVPSGSRAFDALQMWLDQHPYSQRAKSLSATDGRRDNDDYPQASRGRDPMRVLFTPAPGHHILWVDRRPVWLNRQRKDTSGSGGRSMGFRETITLTLLGRSQEVARKLFDDALALVQEGDNEVRLLTSSRGEWYPVATAKMRSVASVVLPTGLAESIVGDVDRFFASQDWYDERGIPWRLGFLFEGPPGTGKTSLIKALAGQFGLDLYHAGIASRGMTDEQLMALLNRIPGRSALLLEDVDRVVSADDVRGETGGVTFSGLLNALDGVASRPGLIVFMTTNHPEKLDAALVRPGRVNHRHTFPLATSEQAGRLFLHFYAGLATPQGAARFAALGADHSPAELQQVMLDHRDDPAGAIAALTTTVRLLEAA